MEGTAATTATAGPAAPACRAVARLAPSEVQDSSASEILRALSRSATQGPGRWPRTSTTRRRSMVRIWAAFARLRFYRPASTGISAQKGKPAFFFDNAVTGTTTRESRGNPGSDPDSILARGR